MAHSYKSNDTELLIGCLDYAITNFIDKDNVLEMLDDLISYRARYNYDDIDNIPDDKMDACIINSEIDDATLSIECDLPDVRLVDVLLQLGFINSDTLLEIKDYIETL